MIVPSRVAGKFSAKKSCSRKTWRLHFCLWMWTPWATHIKNNQLIGQPTVQDEEVIRISSFKFEIWANYYTYLYFLKLNYFGEFGGIPLRTVGLFPVLGTLWTSGNLGVLMKKRGIPLLNYNLRWPRMRSFLFAQLRWNLFKHELTVLPESSW